MGGFDTHSNQRVARDRLMLTLDEAVTAFYRDLKAQGHDQRVLTMTTSEFGRRVEENRHGENPDEMFSRPGHHMRTHDQKVVRMDSIRLALG